MSIDEPELTHSICKSPSAGMVVTHDDDRTVGLRGRDQSICNCRYGRLIEENIIVGLTKYAKERIESG